MKRKYLSRLLLLVTAVLTLSLAGCQSEKDNQDTQKAQTEDTKAPKEDIGSVTPEEEIPQTAPEDIQGEGTSNSVMPDLNNMEFAPMNTPCVFTSESGSDLASLTINSITLTEERSEVETADADAVVIVEYSYENIAAEEPILYGDVNFQLIQEDTLCTPYYLSSLSVPDPVSKGDSTTGQIAFAVSKDATEVTLAFSDEVLGEKVAFTGTIQ